MSQSERERARIRIEEAKWWRHLTFHHQESYFAIEGDKRIDALNHDLTRAALDTPQEPTPAPSQAEIEAGQRKRLKERLAGRPRPPREAFEDIGIPMLNEWADNSVPTIETSHEQPTPAAPPDALVSRITEYLALGGLFNPEQMEHLNVRQLLMDCRNALATPAPREG